MQSDLGLRCLHMTRHIFHWCRPYIVSHLLTNLLIQNYLNGVSTKQRALYLHRLILACDRRTLFTCYIFSIFYWLQYNYLTFKASVTIVANDILFFRGFFCFVFLETRKLDISCALFAKQMIQMKCQSFLSS